MSYCITIHERHEFYTPLHFSELTLQFVRRMGWSRQERYSRVDVAAAGDAMQWFAAVADVTWSTAT